MIVTRELDAVRRVKTTNVWLEVGCDGGPNPECAFCGARDRVRFRQADARQSWTMCCSRAACLLVLETASRLTR